MTLAENQVRAFFATTARPLPPDRLARLALLLSRDETQRMQRFVRAENRHEYLMAHAMLRLSLSQYAAVHPAAWVFAPQAGGRPVIVGPAHAPHLSFSLSHTEGMVACAVANHRDVGIDIEVLSRATDGLSVAEQFFSTTEIVWLRASPPELQHQRFLELWTLKEAYVKARGLGLSIALDSFSFHIDSGKVRVSFVGGTNDQVADWQFAQFHPSANHTLAVAVDNASKGPVDISIECYGKSDNDLFDVVGPGQR